MPITTLDCFLLKDNNQALVARSGPEINSRACLHVLQAGPYLGTLRPWAQEIFAPPHPYLFVFSYVQLSFQVQLISSTIPAIPLGK